jgi:hypothetical protein
MNTNIFVKTVQTVRIPEFGFKGKNPSDVLTVVKKVSEME